MHWGRQEKMDLNDRKDTLDNQICNIQMKLNHIIVNFLLLDGVLLVFSFALSVYCKIAKEIFAITRTSRNSLICPKLYVYTEQALQLPYGIQTVVCRFRLRFF